MENNMKQFNLQEYIAHPERKAALALGLALDERHGGAQMQITLDTLPNGYILTAKNGNPSEVVLASFREIRGHYEAKDNDKNE